MTRRWLLLLILALGMAALPLAARGAAKRPNIVLIMADDMGYSDLGCYGSEIHTPNIDSLAAGGLRFRQFYNTARCCPTRAALLTGLYSHQAGIGHMVEDRAEPGYRGYLNDRCVTLAEALKPAGYHTLMTGKWHVGEQRPHWPVDRGFEKSYALISGGSNYFRPGPATHFAIDGEKFVPTDPSFYITDWFTENAVNLIGEYGRKPEPFFLYLTYTAPHWPLHARPEDIAKYRGKYLGGWDALRESRRKRMIELGIIKPEWGLTPRDPEVPAWSEVQDKDAQDLRMAVYAAQIDRMDQGIGRVLAKLRETGAEANTLVLFLSDNGGCAEKIDRGTPGVPPGGVDSFLSYGPPWANASNTPFRLYKHWEHEGGISTPLIARWPAVVKPNTWTDQPGHLTDVMATFLDIAGGTYPATYNGLEITPLEGKTLRPIFEGKQRPERTPIFWEHEGNRAVRVGKWKLVAQHRKPWELYDLEADRTELHDLAAEHPDRVREMTALYEAWAKRAGVLPWPVPLPKKAE